MVPLSPCPQDRGAAAPCLGPDSRGGQRGGGGEGGVAGAGGGDAPRERPLPEAGPAPSVHLEGRAGRVRARRGVTTGDDAGAEAGGAAAGAGAAGGAAAGGGAPRGGGPAAAGASAAHGGRHPGRLGPTGGAGS